VHLALEARDRLASEGVQARVVSVPSTNLFSLQSEQYRDKVLSALRYQFGGHKEKTAAKKEGA